ncbi:MAG: hypothetical protein QXX20_04740 [Candidatus Thermoplasmatota archaeon]
MKKKSFIPLFDNTNGVAGIIVAVMIVGLVIGVISIIQTIYVPRWMQEREAEHMSQVANQFSQFKYAVDNLVVTQSTIPITTFITLGSKELGFLSSSRAYGHIQLLSESHTIEIFFSGGTRSAQLRSFQYSSDNAYFLNQEYTYENTAIILKQSEGSVMLSKPTITAATTPEPQISIHCVDFNPEGGISSLGGYGTYPIQIYFREHIAAEQLSSATSLTITSEHYQLWEKVVTDILTKAGFKKDGQPTDLYRFSVAFDPNNNKIIISFDGTRPTISFEKTILGIQFSPGWIQ